MDVVAGDKIYVKTEKEKINLYTVSLALFEGQVLWDYPHDANYYNLFTAKVSRKVEYKNSL